MKFDSLLKSNHDLKKNGYKILRKLHKLEKRSNLSKAYSAYCSEGCFVVLSCRNLSEILYDLYGNREEQYINLFLQRTAEFVKYLEFIADSRSVINPKMLVSYLTSYTTFFNRIIEEHYVKFSPNKDLYTKWNVGCLMAYVAVWGNR